MHTITNKVRAPVGFFVGRSKYRLAPGESVSLDLTDDQAARLAKLNRLTVVGTEAASKAEVPAAAPVAAPSVRRRRGASAA